MRQKFFGAVLAVMAASMLLVGVAGAAEYPQSTNDANQANGGPYVREVAKGPGTVTLEFVNPTPFLFYWEISPDGVGAKTDVPHDIVEGDFVYEEAVCIDNRTEPFAFCYTQPSVTVVFSADEYVDVRLALGGESDWYYDWTPFAVGDSPSSADDCKKGGFSDFGFSNQGQCLQFLRTR